MPPTSSRRFVDSASNVVMPLKCRYSRNENGNSSHDSARPRICVAISRESICAEDPVMKTSHFSVRISRSTKYSHPGTTWISSKKQYTV